VSTRRTGCVAAGTMSPATRLAPKPPAYRITDIPLDLVAMTRTLEA
jgi:hypothetical protein